MHQKWKKNNMAEQTPQKTMTTCTLTSYVCRCCNCSFPKNPVDLFGVKYDFKQLVALLENLPCLDFVENDGFPRKICKSCYNLVKQFAEFKKSQADQAKLIRFNRGKKELESPSVSEECQKKRGKNYGDKEQPRARQRLLQLQSVPAATQPKECRVQLPKSAARILPAFLQPKTAVEPSKGVLIPAKSGLCNSEVCNKVSGIED